MYHLRLPHPALQPYIESYWRYRAVASNEQLHETIFVDGQADILFNFGVPYAHHRVGSPSDVLIHSGNLDGQRDYPLTIAQMGAIDLIGVRFKVGGLAAFIPMPMDALSNQVIDLQAGLGLDGVMLENHLYDARGSFEAQATLLDDFFCTRFEIRTGHTVALRLADWIAQPGSMRSIRRLSSESGYSIRSVDRFFRQYLGITPKFYAQIVRFRRALESIQHSAGMPLAEIALHHGYYDQAHFSRSLERFSGQTPQQLRAEAAHYNPQRVHFLQDE
jgi:AraC-like DNA-binding protein